MHKAETFHSPDLLLPKIGRQQMKVQRPFERPTPPPFPARRLESVPQASNIESGDSGLLRIVTNRERSTFSGEFGFDLVGMVWNGQTRNNVEQRQGVLSTNGDRLVSRLLPLLENNTSVQFRYSGGANTNFGWSIRGLVQEAASKRRATIATRSLQHSIQMMLSSEPGFCFAPRTVTSAEESLRSTYTWATTIVPQRILLRKPERTLIGFANDDQRTGVHEQNVCLALPAAASKSFRSLAEAVVLNPRPIMLLINFSRFTLDKEAQDAVTSLLEWIDRNPDQFEQHLAAQGIKLELAESIENQLTHWIQNPNGSKAECGILSTGHPSESLVQMIGSDVFGTRVDYLTQPISCVGTNNDRTRVAEIHTDVDLRGCLYSGAVWPSLFPSFDSLSNARVQRLFNHEIATLSTDGILLGCVAEDKHRGVRLTESDRSQHLYCLGATGTGKSTLLFNMILQDIRAGRGVGLIDPHGDLYDQLLDAMPIARAKDVFLFNPGSLDSAPGINPLECHGPNRSMQVNFAINELLKTFERIYDMSICGGPMFETYFRNAMLLLLESGLEEVTLTELSLVFEDSDYRKFLKGRCTNPLVVGFWNGLAEKVCGEASLSNIAPYITSKLNAFTCNALIRPIIGQAKSTIAFRNVIDRQKILLVKLSKGILGELDTQLLGSFLLSKIFATAMGRAGIKSAKRTSFHLYVDEFQNFTNDTVAHMLSEARKYGLYLTLANQNLSQLLANQGHQNILNAVLGNVGNLIAFRVGPNDAERLWPYIEPEFSGLDLQGLANYHAIGRLMTPQGPTRPFVFKTRPSTMPTGYRLAKPDVWERREKSFTTPTSEVEAQIIRRREVHTSPKVTKSGKPLVGVSPQSQSSKK